MRYTPIQSNNDKNDNKPRKRKIICYNPPYSANITTNIGKTLLNLIKKHFPKLNKLHKIFNKNTVKFSNNCMSNISSVISGHNTKLLNPIVTLYSCNWIREDFPLQNQCLTANIIFRAHTQCERNKDYKFYYGVAQTPFKERFWNHNGDFSHRQYTKSTELSKYIWSLNYARTPCTVNWSITSKVKGSTKINYCPLCLTEKYHDI